jgi:hypothetical protein
MLAQYQIFDRGKCFTIAGSISKLYARGRAVDPVSLILQALVTGAVEIAKNEVVKDTYTGLKELIKHRFANKPDAEMALAKYEEKPQVWEALLKDELIAAEVDRDAEVLALAKQLLEKAKPEEAAAGKYNVQFHGEVKGMVMGDNNQVTQTNN